MEENQLVEEGYQAAAARDFCQALKIANHLATAGNSRGADEVLHAIAGMVMLFAKEKGY